jgi:hypothetical protein
MDAEILEKMTAESVPMSNFSLSARRVLEKAAARSGKVSNFGAGVCTVLGQNHEWTRMDTNQKGG